MTVAVDHEVGLFGIGTSLREARIRRGIELEQVEVDTCIRAANLELIEEELFDDLPGDVYAAAFVRTYATYLGLDAERFVDVFKESRAYESGPIVHEATATLQPPSRSPLYALAALVAAATVAGAVVLLHREEATAPVAPTPAAAPQPAPTPPRPLQLRAAGSDSWIVVRFGNQHGKLVWRGTLRQGNMLRFGLDRQLWVGIGNPSAVTARVGSKPVPLDPSRSRFVFARGR